VTERGDEGVDGKLQYVDVAQDLHQNPEGPKVNLANEGKPRINNPLFKIMQITLAMIVNLRFRS
jgi:hypothetical protein